ncbi:MAG: 4Fe-4S binding protein [Bacteroidales bacterium]|nr:4Fe-4S binding protein [Bacteroidales bacterium]
MKLSIIDAARCVGCQSCMFACVRRDNVAGIASSCIFIKSRGGISTGFRVITCHACENPPCARVCPTNALELRKGGGVKLIPEKCIGCGHCKEACIIGAVRWNPEQNKPSICIHCGYCVKYCPHGVLEMKK